VVYKSPLEVLCLHTKELWEEDSLTAHEEDSLTAHEEDSLTDMYLGLLALSAQVPLQSHWETGSDRVENGSLVGHKIQSVFEIDNPRDLGGIFVQVNAGENDE
jgi:hypothetical protein